MSVLLVPSRCQQVYEREDHTPARCRETAIFRCDRCRRKLCSLCTEDCECGLNFCSDCEVVHLHLNECPENPQYLTETLYEQVVRVMEHA